MGMEDGGWDKPLAPGPGSEDLTAVETEVGGGGDDLLEVTAAAYEGPCLVGTPWFPQNYTFQRVPTGTIEV